MPDIELNMNDVSFDEMGRVKIANTELATRLTSIFAGTETAASCSNTGCGNSINGSCGEANVLFNQNEVTIAPNEVIFKALDFNRELLRAKLQGDVAMKLSMRGVQ